MTEEDKNFNKWLKEYNSEQVKVFEKTDLKIAYLQGCSDEVEKWENKNVYLRKRLEQAKKYLEECVYNVVSPERLRNDIEQFLKEK